jgi:hypothetical protein
VSEHPKPWEVYVAEIADAKRSRDDAIGRCVEAQAEVERLREALGECYSDLCKLEPLLTDTEQARLLSSAISWCKYLKQPEWNDRVDRLRGEGEKSENP